jgi:hypothetical protein
MIYKFSTLLLSTAISFSAFAAEEAPASPHQPHHPIPQGEAGAEVPEALSRTIYRHDKEPKFVQAEAGNTPERLLNKFNNIDPNDIY